jgi:hypothetical protein
MTSTIVVVVVGIIIMIMGTATSGRYIPGEQTLQGAELRFSLWVSQI